MSHILADIKSKLKGKDIIIVKVTADFDAKLKDNNAIISGMVSKIRKFLYGYGHQNEETHRPT
jgi:hypothetical protein